MLQQAQHDDNFNRKRKHAEDTEMKSLPTPGTSKSLMEKIYNVHDLSDEVVLNILMFLDSEDLLHVEK